VTFPIIQSKYLAQVYCIAPEYALAVYDMLKDKKFDFSEVRARSKDAPTMGKETRFMPSEGDKLVGYQAKGIYNT
jgi:catalase